MPLLLLVAFIVVPLVELAVIGAVADVLTLGPTLVLLLLDSVVGAWLVRREGARTWQSFRDAIGHGRVPGDELIEGALLLVGGALLLTPGFVTDAVGLALVVPVTRRPLAAAVRRRAVRGTLGWITVGPGAWTAAGRSQETPTDAARRDPRRASGRRRPTGRDAAGSGGDGQPDVEVLSVERDDPPQVGGPDGRD